VTATSDHAKTIQRIVVVFDVCSSTSILEDLLRSENQLRWRNLLIDMKKFLTIESKSHGFAIYKFVGDGWILLFDPSFGPKLLFEFLKSLSEKYQKLFKRTIEPVLSIEMPNVGITFGIDKGTLVRIEMNGKTEYIGRPLNVAARLQSAIKDKDKTPGGKILMSNSAFAEFEKDIKPIYRIETARRNLRNLSGADEYVCKKLWLFEKPKV
jgi:class 3 adenylate cyclase